MRSSALALVPAGRSPRRMVRPKAISRTKGWTKTGPTPRQSSGKPVHQAQGKECEDRTHIDRQGEGRHQKVSGRKGHCSQGSRKTTLTTSTSLERGLLPTRIRAKAPREGRPR